MIVTFSSFVPPRTVTRVPLWWDPEIRTGPIPSRPGKNVRDGISFDGIPRVGFSTGNLPVAFEFREFLAHVSETLSR